MKLTAVESKAVELVAQGKVGDPLPDARVFPVQASSGDVTYLVVLAPGVASCDCLAGVNGRACRHVVAAKLAAEVADRPPARSVRMPLRGELA